MRPFIKSSHPWPCYFWSPMATRPGLKSWKVKIGQIIQWTCAITNMQSPGWNKMNTVNLSNICAIFMPDHKMSGALCHGLCVGVRKHLVSINYRTNAWVDWSDFSVAYWGWLEEGYFRWSALPLIQDGRYGRHLWFGFLRLDDKRLRRFILFFCGLEVTRERFLSMISAAAHPRWPLRLPSWIWFSDQSLGRLVWFFGGSLGVTGGRFLLMTNMAAMAAILDLVSIDYLTNACVDRSDFFVAHWGWLEEGSFRLLALLLIQDGRHPLVSIDFLTYAWVSRHMKISCLPRIRHITMFTWSKRMRSNHDDFDLLPQVRKSDTTCIIVTEWTDVLGAVS
jgi:hypothetical protein